MKQTAVAPGRVELLGNHTDYNGGVVLSAALDLVVSVEGQCRTDGRIVLRSTTGTEVVEAEIGKLARTETWADYPLGVASVLIANGAAISGFEADFSATLPLGAGLSSSAAIEVATGVLLMKLFGLQFEPIELARHCRRAENEFVGVNCGLLDQASSIFGRKGHAVYLDCRTETVERVPFPDGYGLLVVDSGVKHELVGGEYNERRAMCFQAAEILGVPALRDASMADVERAAMPEVVKRRAAHIVGENDRVSAALHALRGEDAAAFGRLMNVSHESSIHNFENSTAELDLLAALARGEPGICGARLTGGGFGGSIVALGANDALEPAGAAIAAKYSSATGHTATPIVCHPGDGAWALAEDASLFSA